MSDLVMLFLCVLCDLDPKCITIAPNSDISAAKNLKFVNKSLVNRYRIRGESQKSLRTFNTYFYIFIMIRCR